MKVAGDMTALRDQRDHQAVQRSNSGSEWTETGLVFTTLRGALIQPANVNKLFGALSDQAGVRRIRFHNLRHSCATLLYELGLPIENIQDILGHSSPVITKVLYVGASEKVQRVAAERLGDLFAE
jgi:integrase